MKSYGNTTPAGSVNAGHVKLPTTPRPQGGTVTLTQQVTEERRHFIPEQASPDPQTARLRDLIALIDQALTEAYHTAREVKRQHERTAA